MAMLSWKWIGKVSLIVLGVVFILLGISALLAVPPNSCITIFIFPITCSTPNPFGWLGGLITALIGLALVWFGFKVV